MEEAEPARPKVSRFVRGDTATTGARFAGVQPTLETPTCCLIPSAPDRVLALPALRPLTASVRRAERYGELP
jgi:hypothetical protein